MKITRDYFKGQDVSKNTICIISPEWTEIDNDAFADWNNLKYIAIPDEVKDIAPNAFNWENIAVIALNYELELSNSNTKFEQIPYNETSISLLKLMSKTDELDDKLNLSPEVIQSRQKKIRELITKYSKELENKESNLNELFNVVTETYNKLQSITSNSHVLEAEIEKIIGKYIQETQSTLQKVQELITKKCKETEDAINNAQSILQGKIDEESRKAIEESTRGLIDAKQALSKVQETIDKSVEEANKKIAKMMTEFFSKYQEFEEKSASKINCQSDEAVRKLNKIVNEAIEKIARGTDKITDVVVEEALNRVRDKTPYKNIVIDINGVQQVKLKGELFHKSFKDVLQVLSLHLHPLLVGPAGSGKNVILEQAAKALDLEFRYVNDVTEEHKVMGFVDANGNFQTTQFFEAFTKGGLMMIDELDNSHPSALLAINAALGTGYHHYLTFPDGKLYESDPNFYLAAAANTYGTGSDAIYCGRSSLDGASLNRFVPIFIDYDKDLERQLIKNTNILELYWAVREQIAKNKIRHVISTRNIVNADRMLQSGVFDIEKIFDYTLIQSMTEEDLRMIVMPLSKSHDPMIRQFVNHLQRMGVTVNEYQNNSTSNNGYYSNGYNDYSSDGYNNDGYYAHGAQRRQRY